MSKKLIIICVVLIIGLLFSSKYYYTLYKQEQQQTLLFKTKYNQEVQATKIQQKLNETLTKKYEDAYNEYIKEGNYCYNHIVEEDVLKMLGEK